MKKKLQIAVVGPAGIEEYPKAATPNPVVYTLSYEIGRLLAEAGCIVVTGGKSGIMEEAARGAKEVAGSVTVGVVKGRARYTSNPYIDVEVVTGAIADGLDEYEIVTMSDGLIILGGGAGTLQEIVLAYRNKKPMVALVGCGGWGEKLAGEYLDERASVKIQAVATPEEAVRNLLEQIAHHTTDNSS